MEWGRLCHKLKNQDSGVSSIGSDHSSFGKHLGKSVGRDDDGLHTKTLGAAQGSNGRPTGLRHGHGSAAVH